MPEDKSIRPGQKVQRSAATNAGLGIAAFVAAKPYIDTVIDKVTTPKESGPKVELPSGSVRPTKD